MQLPTSGPGSHPAGNAYHIPAPNVMVSSMGHILNAPNAPIMHAQSGPPTPGPPHMGHMGPPPMPPHIINEHMIRGNPHHGTPGPPHPGVMFNHYGPPSQQNPYQPGVPPMGTPGFCGLELRIHDMNRRLQHKNRPSPQDNNVNDNDACFQWWNAFASDFFDDDAVMELSFKLEDGIEQNYKIGRVLIPRYFRSIFAGGVKEMYYILRHPCCEIFLTPTISQLECGECLMVTKHDKPGPGLFEVHTECKLTCIFTSEEMNQHTPRIKRWHMAIVNYEEYIPRQILSSGIDGQCPEQLSKDNITRQGLTAATMKYLKLCAILEPMQALMSVSKAYPNIGPREALRRENHDRYQQNQKMQHAIQMQMQQHHQRAGPQQIPQQTALPPDEPPRAPPKTTRKRNRKSSSSAGANATNSKKKNASPAPQPILPTASHVDVMVVSEPSLMGGEYGDEDERVISRLENTQYDPSAPVQMLGPGGPPAPRPPLMHPSAMRPPLMHDGQPPAFDWPGPPGNAFAGPPVTSAPPQGRGTPQTPVTGSSRTGTPSAPFTEGMSTGSPMQRGATPTNNINRTIKTEEGTNGN